MKIARDFLVFYNQQKKSLTGSLYTWNEPMHVGKRQTNIIDQ